MRRKARSESMSADLSEKLAHMKLPQPERIFGPDATQVESKEGLGAHKKHGVNPADWDAVVLDDDVPESVRAPERMTHSRNTSRA
jgi:tryptophanyl-tRNA synthetase